MFGKWRFRYSHQRGASSKNSSTPELQQSRDRDPAASSFLRHVSNYVTEKYHLDYQNIVITHNDEAQ